MRRSRAGEHFFIVNFASYRNLRQVSTDEGKVLAQENQAAWIETSAKNNVNVGKWSQPQCEQSLKFLQAKYSNSV